ncbi:signal peptidase I [Rathayibacter rathayi]|uniref:Signal peptidase I n=1 Tax=Rathayibacter rathayi TaxID=33887 RepID=A0ABD6W7Y5_RATRA|nr:signal peptidase I [Rathayibacter rathayi]AZZ48082.1 signal peptidase I [Rathayibacter rathayi]MWV75609.1 signal peptidase I [Rathayibacter rathayi NCPPB 2980 = VKM Ac-1601]PPF13331.1 signal peptidase I [Rathayibacter rathayi]PPF23409.1 signal peptidase I [Rathayibacter rathayi]PPF49163.1 signal peptidase I [Rathayibacter rathayi]
MARTTRSTTGKRRWYSHPAVTILAAIVLIALVQTFLVKVYTVPTGSMENTLQGGGFFGDRILVDRTLALQGGPQEGQIVVFSRDAEWGADDEVGSPLSEAVKTFGDVTSIGPSHEEFLVKRLIAQGGHTVSCCDAEGHLLVDGKPLDESYVFEDFPFTPGTLDCATSPASQRCFDEYTVPEGSVFVLGDHRSNSNDSLGGCRSSLGPIDSCVKTVPIDRVTGRVFAVAWPLTRWHLF